MRQWHWQIGVILRPTAIAIALIPLAGCIAKAKLVSDDYDPPVSERIENSIIVPDDASRTWDRLVRGLAESFFAINAIQKESRLINVSFSADRPDEYVTCGNRRFAFEIQGHRKNNAYDPATSLTLWWPAGSQSINNEPGGLIQFPLVHELRRRMTLEGRVNIYVAPDANGTLVTVNARYVLRNDPQGSALLLRRVDREIQRQPLNMSSESVTFDTASPGQSRDGDPRTICQSRGNLERKILELARGSSPTPDF